MKAKTTYPLTIYFDASCPLCAIEMDALKARDRAARLVLVDCSTTGFSDLAGQQAGLRQIDFMQIIHARCGDGSWLRGVDVFEAAYLAVDLKLLSFIWGCRAWRPLLDFLYPVIARHRQLLSRLGVPAIVRAGISALGGGTPCPADRCELT